MTKHSLFKKEAENDKETPLKISLKIDPSTAANDGNDNTPTPASVEPSTPTTFRISFKRSMDSLDDGLASGPVTPASAPKSTLGRSENVKVEDTSPQMSDYDEESEDDSGSTSETATSAKKPRWAPRRARTMNDVLRRVIRQLIKLDRYGFFLEPVDTNEVRDYLDVISQPMDLGTMRKKVEQKQYTTFEDFRNDFNLVINNCKAYNGPANAYHKEADRLMTFSARFFDKAREAMDQLPAEEQKSDAHVNVDVEMDHGEEAVGEEGDSTSKSNLLQTPISNVPGLTDRKHKTPVALYKKGPNGGYVYTSLQRVPFVADGSRLMGAREMAILPTPSLPTRYVHSLGTSLANFMNATNANVLAHQAQSFVPDCVYLGPYTTYAPSFDSTRGPISMDEANFINLAVGDIQGLAFAASLRHFVEPMSDSMKQHVDRILDLATLGYDSALKQQQQQNAAIEGSTEVTTTSASLLDELKVELKEAYDAIEGLTMSGEEARSQWQSINQEMDAADLRDPMQTRLNRCAKLLFSLQHEQGVRLITREKSLSEKEHQIGEELKCLLVDLLQTVPSGDLASKTWIQDAMKLTMASNEPIFRGTLPNAQQHATTARQ